MSISSISLVRMSTGYPCLHPSWFSPLGDQTTEELDWGLITATPTQPYEDWGVEVNHKRRNNTEGVYRELGILT